MIDLRELGERFLSNTCYRNFVWKIIKTQRWKQRSKHGWDWRLRVKSLSCGVNLDVIKILNANVYIWWSLLYVYVLKTRGLTNLWRRIDTITTLWTKFFYEYLLEDEQELSVEEMLMVYFGTPSMFITLWFGFYYGTNPQLGTLII
jgi:hypothetical protein